MKIRLYSNRLILSNGNLYIERPALYWNKTQVDDIIPLATIYWLFIWWKKNNMGTVTWLIHIGYVPGMINTIRALLCFAAFRKRPISPHPSSFRQWHWSSYPDSKVHGANMGPIWGPSGPRWAPCWPHELCYLGMLLSNCKQRNPVEYG